MKPLSESTVKSVFWDPVRYSAAIAESPAGWGADAANSATNSALPGEVSNSTDGPRLPVASQLSSTPPSAP